MARRPSQIKPITRAKKNTVMLYGAPGVGKTRMLGTHEGRTLIIRPPTDHTESIKGGENVYEWVVHDWSEMDDVLQAARSFEPGEWDWVWFDSISLFQDTGIDDIWDVVIAKHPHRKEYGADKGEYGVNMQRLARWMRHMVALATDHGLFHFGVTAHPMELEDPTGDTKLRPYVQGKNMSHKICGYMHVVAYLETREGRKGRRVRVLHTEETDTYEAKDQLDLFANHRLISPTMPKLMAAIEAARPAATTQRRRRRRRKGR